MLSADEFIQSCSDHGFNRIFLDGAPTEYSILDSLRAGDCNTEALRELFKKIDVNNDGGMDWREVVHFLLNCNAAQLSAKEWDHSQVVACD